MTQTMDFLKRHRDWIVVGVMAVLLTVSGIWTGQAFLRMLPLYVSLVIAMLQAQVNRLASLLVSLNAFLYAAAFVHYGLYASAAYAVFISSPLQFMTYLQWKKHAYRQATVFRRLTDRQRIGVVVGLLLCGILLQQVLRLMDSQYRFLDNAITLLGILTTFLAMAAYIEYTGLMIVMCLISTYLYGYMMKKSPEQLPYLIYTLYNLVCSIVAYFRAMALYKEQQQALQNKDATT